MVLMKWSYLGAWERVIRTNILARAYARKADAARGALTFAPGGPVGIAGAPAGIVTHSVKAAEFKDASAQMYMATPPG